MKSTIIFLATSIVILLGIIFYNSVNEEEPSEPAPKVEEQAPVVEEEPEPIVEEEPVVPEVEEPEVVVEPKTEEEIQKGREEICATGRINIYLLNEMEVNMKEMFPDNKGLLETINENGDIGFSDGTIVFTQTYENRYSGLHWDLRGEHCLAFVEFYNNYLAK